MPGENRVRVLRRKGFVEARPIMRKGQWFARTACGIASLPVNRCSGSAGEFGLELNLIRGIRDRITRNGIAAARLKGSGWSVGSEGHIESRCSPLPQSQHFSCGHFQESLIRSRAMAINIKPSHKGLLHKKLGVPQGQKIPASKIAAAKNSPSAATRKQATFAQNAKKWSH